MGKGTEKESITIRGCGMVFEALPQLLHLIQTTGLGNVLFCLLPVFLVFPDILLSIVFILAS